MIVLVRLRSVRNFGSLPSTFFSRTPARRLFSYKCSTSTVFTGGFLRFSRSIMPSMEQNEEAEHEHHDADLNTFQKTTISLVAPQLLNNVPNPWYVFLVLMLLDIAALGGLFW